VLPALLVQLASCDGAINWASLSQADRQSLAKQSTGASRPPAAAKRRKEASSQAEEWPSGAPVVTIIIFVHIVTLSPVHRCMLDEMFCLSEPHSIAGHFSCLRVSASVCSCSLLANLLHRFLRLKSRPKSVTASLRHSLAAETDASLPVCDLNIPRGPICQWATQASEQFTRAQVALAARSLRQSARTKHWASHSLRQWTNWPIGQSATH